MRVVNGVKVTYILNAKSLTGKWAVFLIPLLSRKNTQLLKLNHAKVPLTSYIFQHHLLLEYIQLSLCRKTNSGQKNFKKKKMNRASGTAKLIGRA